MTLFEGLTLVVAAVSLVLVILQVRIANQTLREDHLRRKQQATLDYLIHDVRPHWRDELRLVVQRFGDIVPMPEKAMDDLRSDPEASGLVIKLLGNIEHMAVAINVGVYDIAVLDRASGAFVIRVYRQFLPYIRRAQASQSSHAKTYQELDILVAELCRRRGIPVPNATKAESDIASIEPQSAA